MTPLRLGDVELLILHHSDADPITTVETMRGWHLLKNWSDIAYHRVIRRPDPRIDAWTIEPGRSLGAIGAHDQGQNHNSWGICAGGRYQRERPSPGLVYALKVACLQLCLARGKLLRIEGHGENEPPGHGTDCPAGIPVDEIRAWVAEQWAALQRQAA